MAKQPTPQGTGGDVTAGRITWEQGQYGTRIGYVNGIRLFTISYSVTRGAGYELRNRVPGYKEHLGPFAELDDAKARAEDVLRRFVGRIGATFETALTKETP